MNGLIFSCLAAFAFLYQGLVTSVIKKGRIREGYCSLWIGDLLFAIFGAILTITLYRFSFLPFFTLRNLLFTTGFILITILLLILAPTGLGLLGKKESGLEEETIHAEYHFNDTLGIIRNLFLLMLLLFPIFFSMASYFPEKFPFLSMYNEGQLCSAFCLITFLLLLPICLRQSIFWIRNITQMPSETEKRLIKMEKAHTYYKRRNMRI